MKNDLESLFRDAGRISPNPGLWRRIADRSSLAPDVDAPAGEAQAGETPDGDNLPEGEERRSAWMEVGYLRAAGMLLAAGLLALAAFGALRRHPGEAVREASAEQSETSIQGESEVFDPELLEWQADLGDYELVADQAEEVL